MFQFRLKISLPEFNVNGVTLKLIAGEAFGRKAPVKIYSPLFYLEVKMPAGGQFTLPAEYRERALYLIGGRLNVGGTAVERRTMPVFSAGDAITVAAEIPSHLVLLGGEPLPEQRFIWWNFVSTSADRIVQAKEDWKAGRFGAIPGDDKEFIPLPE